MKKILRNLYKNTYDFSINRNLGRYAIVRYAHKLLQSKLKSDFVEFDGNKMFLDPNDSLQMSCFGSFEPFETEVVKKLIKIGNNVLDIGANIGYFSLLFAKLVGNNGRVYAFEPEPENFRILKKNLEINHYNNTMAIQKAISDKNHTVKLFLNEINTGNHSIYKSSETSAFIDIESIKLDDFSDIQNKRIDFIKIDIEGAEIDAFKGMKNVLQKNSQVTILSEFNLYLLNKFNKKPREYVKILNDLGFEIFLLDSKKKKIVPFVLDEFLHTIPTTKSCFNLLSIKENETTKFMKMLNKYFKK